MSSMSDPAGRLYAEAKQAAERRYAVALAAIVYLRGGNEVRERARKAAGDRLAADYHDAYLLALYHGNPVVDAAEAALRAFGVDLTRSAAVRLLQGWRHTPELSVREREAVLARFPVDVDDDQGDAAAPAPGDPTVGLQQRPALPGELCSCGRPAVVVYLTEQFGPVGYCGVPGGGAR